MNKKVLSIILGIVVLIIWVKVFSKIFDQFSDDEYATVEAPSMNVVDLSKYIKRDSLPALNLNYRDPFLGKSYHNTNKSSSQNNNSTSKNVKRVSGEKKAVKITEWPLIQYHGFVKVTGTSSGTLLLKVNQNLIKVREGETLDNELIVKKAFRDSIVISNNSEVKTFYK